MKQIIFISLIVTLSGCNPFAENKVLKYTLELNALVAKMDEYPSGTYHKEEMDELIVDDIRNLNIDYVIKNGERINPRFSGFVEENDSLIIFIKSSGSIFDPERRIIFDYSYTPRNFGSELIKGASYNLVQLDKRWYYVEIGFD